MSELLDREDQDWLLNELAGLVRAQGADRFLYAPLLEPTPQFFPDEWEPSVRGVEVLAWRLLLYAGLEQLRPEVTTFIQPQEIREFDEFGGAKSWGHDGFVAWFEGIEGERCLFGVAEERIGEPEMLVATLSHEVAHVWRTVHGLVLDDPDKEEYLTDVTTVYLGFGVLTTNGTHRFRTSGSLSGSYASTTCSLQRAGYLPSEAMSFLLAAQSLARAQSWWSRRRLYKLLEPNQASFYRRSVKILRRRTNLQSMLSISPSMRPHSLPPAAHPPIRLAPAERPLPQASVRQRFNEGGHVYRVKRSKLVPYSFWGGMIGLVGFGIFVSVLGWPGLVAGSAIGIVIGGFIGHSCPWDYCSDPDCAAEIPVDLMECPRCGGVVRGSIAHPDERLACDESMEDRNGTRY